jgi:hypothetical protein
LLFWCHRGWRQQPSLHLTRRLEKLHRTLPIKLPWVGDELHVGQGTAWGSLHEPNALAGVVAPWGSCPWCGWPLGSMAPAPLRSHCACTSRPPWCPGLCWLQRPGRTPRWSRLILAPP